MKFKVLDLFCGAGGFSAGLEHSQIFKTLIALDFDKYATQTFQKNFPNAKVINGDITKKSTRNNIIFHAKKLGINMIVGGPPCQGFSLKGKKLGIDDPRNFLFLEFFNIVKILKPEVVIIENVKNLLTTENGFFKKQIIDKFSSIGYIINVGVLNAKNFGVPQNRERAIIIGSKSRSISLPIENSAKIVTVKDAISDLSYLSSGEGKYESFYTCDFQSEYQKKLRGKKIYNHEATNHSQLALKKLKMIPPEGNKSSLPLEFHGKQKFSTTWSRLEWNNVSPTIDTRFDTPSNGRNSHPELDRAITPREAARLQSFHDNFIFCGPKSAVCKQIGNAVPPLLGQALGDTIVNAYKENRIIKKSYQIYLSDAYTFVKELQQNNIKIDHIVTDPPYNISQSNNFTTMKNPRKGLFFGKWDKSFDLYSWIDDYSKLLKTDGSMIIFCSYRFISHIIDKLESVDMIVKDILIWKKTNPMPRNITRRYVQDVEFAIWAVKKDAKWIFNKPTNLPYLRSQFETPTVAGNEKTGHPTQKSLNLMERIIQIHSNVDDIILDPFMGSGTTGVASLNLNRKFIGIELEDEYFRIATNRISKASNKFSIQK